MTICGPSSVCGNTKGPALEFENIEEGFYRCQTVDEHLLGLQLLIVITPKERALGVKLFFGPRAKSSFVKRYRVKKSKNSVWESEHPSKIITFYMLLVWRDTLLLGVLLTGQACDCMSDINLPEAYRLVSASKRAQKRRNF